MCSKFLRGGRFLPQVLSHLSCHLRSPGPGLQAAPQRSHGLSLLQLCPSSRLWSVIFPELWLNSFLRKLQSLSNESLPSSALCLRSTSPSSPGFPCSPTSQFGSVTVFQTQLFPSCLPVSIPAAPSSYWNPIATSLRKFLHSFLLSRAFSSLDL